MIWLDIALPRITQIPHIRDRSTTYTERRGNQPEKDATLETANKAHIKYGEGIGQALVWGHERTASFRDNEKVLQSIYTYIYHNTAVIELDAWFWRGALRWEIPR